MIIDCLADLHGHYPYLEGGALLIVAGDLIANDHSWDLFYDWIWEQSENYKKVIYISGNHDNNHSKHFYYLKDSSINDKVQYLCDSGTEFDYLDIDTDGLTIVRKRLKIWGSPWTKTFPGMNPACKAFTVDKEEELAEKWVLIPNDVDILVTHCPPHGILDRVVDHDKIGSSHPPSTLYKHCGSISLTDNVMRSTRRQLHVFGHVHESYGIEENRWGGYSVNASYVNEHYEPVNKPVRVIL